MGTLFSNWTMDDVIRHQNRIKSQQTIKNIPQEEAVDQLIALINSDKQLVISQ